MVGGWRTTFCQSPKEVMSPEARSSSTSCLARRRSSSMPKAFHIEAASLPIFQSSLPSRLLDKPVLL